MLEVSNLMRGGCMSFGLHLHKRSRMTLFGLFDDVGQMHHVGVGEENAEILFDGRGAVFQDDFATWRGIPCAGSRLEVVSADEVRAVMNENSLPDYSWQAMDAYMRRTGLFRQMPILPAPSRSVGVANRMAQKPGGTAPSLG